MDDDSMPWNNISSKTYCFENIHKNSCTIDDSEFQKRSSIAIIRLIVSILGITGSLSIIISAIARKQVKSPKVFPIFVISIADGLLALTWIVGAIVWLSGIGSIEHREWCFLPSLLTVMLVCISANLTLVYAVGAYTSIRRKNVTNILSNMDQTKTWRPSKTALLYGWAWCTPVVLLLVCFGAMEGVFNLTDGARRCSCWCVPYFGNILPLAFQEDHATADYVNNIRNLVATYGFIVGTNYLFVFVLLVFMYWKILHWIRNMRKQHSRQKAGRSQYGSIDILLMKGHSQARKRIVYFLSIFIITGIGNVILSYLFAAYEINKLQAGASVHHGVVDHLTGAPMVLFVLQSLTAPLQGFLNAIVYGWTREEFFEAITHKRINSEGSRSRVKPDETDSVFKSDVNDVVVSRSRLRSDKEEQRRDRVSTDSGVFHYTYSETDKLIENR